MAGNSELFAVANEYIRKGYDRKRAFAAAKKELGMPARKARRNPTEVHVDVNSHNARRSKGAKTNPAPKATKKRMSNKAYVSRPSQITERAPSARLKTRRKANLGAPKGVYPNPLKPGITSRPVKGSGKPRKMFSVDYSRVGKDGPWTVAGIFPNRQLAANYADEMAAVNNKLWWRMATI